MSKKFNKAVASTVACLVVASVVQMPAFAASTTTTLGGGGRIDTAIKIAEASWTGAWKGQTTAVLTSSADANLVDALAVAPLAFQEKAPILLTEAGDVVNPDVMAELLKNKVTKVYLTAGTGVLTAKMEEQLKAAKIEVVRLGGADRFATAKNIGEKLTKIDGVAVVNAYSTIDALSIAAMAAANNLQIVMTEKDSTPTVKAGVPVVVVGGSGVVSDKVVTELKATRLGGETRYITNANVIAGADKLKMVDYKTIYIADGSDTGVDALAGSVLAAQTKSPIFIASKDGSLVKEQTDLLTEHKAKDSNIVRLGAQTALESTVKTITGATTPSATGVTVTIMGAKKLQVKFDGAVDDTKAKLELKRESATVDVSKVTYAEDKKSAVIETNGKLIAATYTVNVTGLDKVMTSSVDVKDEKVSEIKITTQTAPLTDDLGLTADVRFSVLNQYSEDVTKEYGSDVNWTSTSQAANNGLGTFELSKGKFQVATNESNKFIPGKEVFLSGVYTNTTTGNTATVSGKIIIGLKAVADEVVMNKVYCLDKEFNTENFTAKKSNGTFANNFSLLYTVKDQYGNEIDSEMAPDVQFINNNPLLFKFENQGVPSKTVSRVEVDGKKYYSMPLTVNEDEYTGSKKGGSGNIQAISTRTGKKSELKIELKALTQLKTFKISSPGTVAAENEKIEIPFVAMDDQGKEIKDYDTLIDIGLNYRESGLHFEKQEDGTAKLMFNTGSKRLAVITVTKAISGIISTLTIDVKNQAEARYIDGLKADKDNAVVQGKSLEYAYNDFKVIDQYGRIMSDENLERWISTPGNGIKVSTDNYFELDKNMGDATKRMTSAYDGSKNSVTLTPKSQPGIGKISVSLSIVKDGAEDATRANASKSDINIENVSSSRQFAKYTIANIKDVLVDRAQDLNLPAVATVAVKVGVKGTTKNGFTVNVAKHFPNSVKLILSNATDNKSKLAVDTGSAIKLTYSYNKDHFKTANDFTEKVEVIVSDGYNVEQIREVKDVKITNKKNVTSVIETTDLNEIDAMAHVVLNNGTISADTLQSFINIKDQRGDKQASYKAAAILTISNVRPRGKDTTPTANNTDNTTLVSNLEVGDKFTSTFTIDGVKKSFDVLVVEAPKSNVNVTNEYELNNALATGATYVSYQGAEIRGSVTIGAGQTLVLDPVVGGNGSVTLYGSIESLESANLVINKGDTLVVVKKASVTGKGTLTVGIGATITNMSTYSLGAKMPVVLPGIYKWNDKAVIAAPAKPEVKVSAEVPAVVDNNGIVITPAKPAVTVAVPAVPAVDAAAGWEKQAQ